MPFPYLDETKELNAITRGGADGSFIELHDGITHYELEGNETGPSVVLVHGFSVPYFIYDPTFDFLLQSGFRVMRYDLFGRGLSDRPRANYDMHLFVRQLKDLLDTLGMKSLILIGLSMGGPITTAFIDRYPDVVEKQVLIDPAGATPVVLSRLLAAVKIPLIGELLLGLFGTQSMLRSIASDFFDQKLVEMFQEKYMKQMQYKGFKRALLSSMRNGMLDSFYSTYERVGKLNKPTLLLWGKDDMTVPFRDSGMILQAIPHAQFHAIEDCGHIPHFEQPALVNPILLEFLNT